MNMTLDKKICDYLIRQSNRIKINCKDITKNDIAIQIDQTLGSSP